MFYVDDYLFEVDVLTVIKTIQEELTNGKLKEVKETSSGIKVTCPCHDGGMEASASCFINDDGIWNCFACGESGKLPKFIEKCFEKPTGFGKSWLVERFIYTIENKVLNLGYVGVLKEEPIKVLDESILSTYQKFHPYLIKRKLSLDICDRFKVGYDQETKSIVFPSWDEQGRLVMITRRSVLDKRFLIPKDVEKPVYLLNFVDKDNIKEVIVCESQINCLYAWSLGFPAIALFGTGTKHQYEVLNKSGIRHYILCFDGDEAGEKGKTRFLANIRKDVLVDYIDIPNGTDLNDFEKDEAIDLIANAKILR